MSISTFGEDSSGALYVSHYAASGQLYRLVIPTSGFTDDPLISGSTSVKAVHLAELRSRVDALRSARSLSAFPWSDSPLTAGSTIIRASHVTELRNALSHKGHSVNCAQTPR